MPDLVLTLRATLLDIQPDVSVGLALLQLITVRLDKYTPPYNMYNYPLGPQALNIVTENYLIPPNAIIIILVYWTDLWDTQCTMLCNSSYAYHLRRSSFRNETGRVCPVWVLTGREYHCKCYIIGKKVVTN